jgi:predicted dehydrogenase
VKRVAVIGGETHLGEVAGLKGDLLEIVGFAVRPEQTEPMQRQLGGVACADHRELFARLRPDVAAIANENDRKAEVVLAALEAGIDVIVDKPIALTLAEQEAIEEALASRPERRLLNLLTLRGHPAWQGLRRAVAAGKVGTPVFCHVRMAVQMKRAQRPSWFLDCRRSGGLFLDLLIHGIDLVEWCTGRRIAAVSAQTGNLSAPQETHLRDHAAVFCELEGGGSALVEGQRLLPDSRGSDYRTTLVGTEGYLDLVMGGLPRLTDSEGAEQELALLPPARSVVADWLAGGDLVPPAASLRANRLAVWATLAAERHERVATLP